MYRYMHTVRLYNSPDDANARPASKATTAAARQTHFDYATWHARLRGVTGNRPAASSPASVYQLDYATWQSRLQPVNAKPVRQSSASDIVDFMTPAELDQPNRQAA